jgi:hypothetical protein
MPNITYRCDLDFTVTEEWRQELRETLRQYREAEVAYRKAYKIKPYGPYTEQEALRKRRDDVRDAIAQ